MTSSPQRRRFARIPLRALPGGLVAALLLLGGCDGEVEDLEELKTPEMRQDPVGKADGNVCEYDWSWLEQPCPDAWIGTDDGCDCGCHVEDPDCAEEPPAQTDDPHDPASCSGDVLTDAEVAEVLGAGAVNRGLGETIARWEHRECTDLTGCSEWQSMDSRFGGTDWAGDVELRVINGEFALEFYGSLADDDARRLIDCTVAAGEINCRGTNYRGLQDITLSGEMKPGCLRISGWDQDWIAGSPQPTGHEYRLAILNRHEPLPEAPPEPPLEPDDPLNPASCDGEPLDQAGIAELFSPGSRRVELGEPRIAWESRDCNVASGCTAWAPMPHSPLAGWPQTVEVIVRHDNTFGLELGGSYSNGTPLTRTCHRTNAGEIGCNSIEVAWRKRLSLSGDLRPGCLRLEGIHAGFQPDRETSDTEYRVALVADY